ncbi:MAG: SGNH/GDSL hydrolase family protein, partial [Candidatus Magnetominusculus sp. LBB02]|nr:SGNH/GDSL hydrolase family protein [Candidatus Magnetominusculus sp. LBB02]
MINVLLTVCSVVFIIALAFGLDFVVRRSGVVKPIGNSRELFINNAFGKSRGNAKNIGAVSFGEMAYTDKFGFRIPKDYKDTHYSNTILMLGDSIAFGVGVKEQDTFTGLMRTTLPDTGVYNAAVVGYNSYDYENVVKSFLPSHPEVTRVVLAYCLNDLNSQSAELIDSELNISAKKKTLIDGARNIGMLAALNEFLRENSTLYIYLKGILTDPQM